MQMPDAIAGIDARPVREMFKTLVTEASCYEWEDNLPRLLPKVISVGLIRKSLKVSAIEALHIQRELAGEGWIDPVTFAPTTLGMALAQHIDRPKLARADAIMIMDQVLAWARRSNADVNARVKIKTIHVFGRLRQGAAAVGDIDLFIDFTTLDLGSDLQPEDQAREDELSDELVAISEYINPSSELDRMIMNVPCDLIFPENM